jgi:hypothetical protein
LAFADSGTKSYREALSTGMKSKVSAADSDGFTTVTYKKKPASGTPSVNTVKQRRQPLIGVRTSASLPVVLRKERSKTLFVSRFNPEVLAVDIEKSFKDQLSLKRLVYSRLKTKFNAYASFHVSVNEDEFPLINSTGVWPNGCLIAPFNGRLTAEQVYSSSTPLTSEITVSSTILASNVNICESPGEAVIDRNFSPIRIVCHVC